MIAEGAGPDHVDLEHVDVARAGSEQLLEQGEALGGGIGRRDDLDRVAGALRPGIDALLADLVFLAERAARERDLDGKGGGR